MIILCYHELAQDETNLWRLKPDTFREHLDTLAGRKVGRFTDPTTEVTITFDDGCSGCLDAGRWMSERGIVGYFYITPGFIDGTVKPHFPTSYLSWDQVRELSRDHVIGAHSMTHPRKFLTVTSDQQRHEMAESKRVIEEQIGKPCLDWATPHGYINPSISELAQSVGFETVVSTKPGSNSPLNLLALQRFEMRCPCPTEELRQILETA